MSLTRTIKVAVVFLIFGHSCWAQSSANAPVAKTNAEKPYISWISQYPDNSSEVKTNSFKRIYNFLVKKDKKKGLLRPVAVLAKNPHDYCVLDQGGQTIFNIAGTKSEVLKCIRKKENYFTSLIGACALPDNEILFTDSRLNKVFLVSADGKEIESLNDSLQLQQPTGIAYSTVTDEIWVVETGAHRIAILNRKGQLIRTIGTRGNENGQFNFPTSICIDKMGDACVVDAMNFRIQIFNSHGEFLSFFGEAGDGAGSMARPKGVATDTYGNIYVVDALFNVVQIFDREGNFLYNFGKQGHGREEFWMPSGIYIDDRNYIYIADNFNSRVQIFQLINGG